MMNNEMCSLAWYYSNKHYRQRTAN